jgi:hypothetical protein
MRLPLGKLEIILIFLLCGRKARGLKKQIPDPRKGIAG